MLDDDWTILREYLRARADELGLRDWQLLLKRDTPNDEAVLGECRPIPGRRFATIRVCPEFRELTDWEQRNVVAHELLHCHFGTMNELVRELTGVVGSQTFEILHAGYDRQQELIVDAIATAVCDGMAPIPWSTSDPDREHAANAPFEGPIG